MAYLSRPQSRIRIVRPDGYAGRTSYKTSERKDGERRPQTRSVSAHDATCHDRPMALTRVRGVYRRPFRALCGVCGRWFYVAEDDARAIPFWRELVIQMLK